MCSRRRRARRWRLAQCCGGCSSRRSERGAGLSDSDLRPEWRYPSATNPFGFIDDCYALNVDGATAWACYYDGFPIVRIEDEVLAGWRNDGVTGVKALAVAGDTAALYGGYGPDRDRLAIGELWDGVFQPTCEYRVPLPTGAEIPPGTHVIGRGSSLHLLTDSDWYQLRFEETLDAMTS
jgi:hypothetical protein